MKQLYYAIQTILHGRGSNVTKVISLSLGLTVGILLFSQIAFELSYEKCYPEAGNLGIVRAYYHNLETGESMGDDGDIYDYSVFAPIAAALAENMYNPQIQISAESETKRSIFREKDKTKRSKKESAQHSKSRNKSFVMTSVSAL